MKSQHQTERRKLEAGQASRAIDEQRARAARVRGGVRGVWDMLTGRYAKVRKENEAEALQSLRRDRAQRDALIRDHLCERADLQRDTMQQRERHARQVLALYRDAARFRQMRDDRAATRDVAPDISR